MDKSIKMTPMMKQFFSFKAQCPEALLLFRCGDFYETYGDDALTVANTLGIVLTKRSNAQEDSPAMCGFPYHSLESYLPRLVRAGFKVAVCDQLEDPKFAKNIVKRGITDIVTPGVVFNDTVLDGRQNNYICCLDMDGKVIGAAFLDVTTGSFRLAQGSQAFIGTLLASFSPKEILVCRGRESRVRELFSDKWYISSIEQWAFAPDSCARRLCRQLNVPSLKGFGIDSVPLAICASGALLSYLEMNHHSALANICTISRIDEGKFVWMDRFTMRNLEIFQSASGPDGVALVEVLDKCASPLGSRMLRSWLAMPSVDIPELESRYDAVECMMENPELLEGLRELLSKTGDPERATARAAAGKILPREALNLGYSIEQEEPLKILLESSGCGSLVSCASSLHDCSELGNTIRHTLCSAPAQIAGKGDIIASGVDEELDSLRSISRGGKDYLQALEKREMERTGINSLKVGYNSVFGYYLEVRNTFKDKVPPEWIRKQTLVGAERYITEELKEYENKILGAEEKIVSIEMRIYASLVEKIQAMIPSLQHNSAIKARIDTLANFAFVAVERSYCRPIVNDSLKIDIKQGRHPVIETLMAPGEEYVPNDILLDSDDCQIIILTGPNMAGKSALLRQTALICLMAQAGCFVPAESATLGLCDKLFTRVGATDNISRGESTFMVEMLETSMILHNISSRSLVLLDEIGRGTSTYDGMSIARAIVEYLHQSPLHPKTLFATHYHELNDMEGAFKRVKNFHVAVKEVDRKVIFLRKMLPGGTERSFGIHVAAMAGMPKKVVDSALATLSRLESKDSSEKSAIFSSAPDDYYSTPNPGIDNDSPDSPSASTPVQLSLFQLDDPLLSDIRDALKAVDINNITPLQAFDLLRSLKSKMGI